MTFFPSSMASNVVTQLLQKDNPLDGHLKFSTQNIYYNLTEGLSAQFISHMKLSENHLPHPSLKSMLLEHWPIKTMCVNKEHHCHCNGVMSPYCHILHFTQVDKRYVTCILGANNTFKLVQAYKWCNHLCIA